MDDATRRANGPGTYCSTHHTMLLNQRNERSECVSMTWRTLSARRYLRCRAFHGGAGLHGDNLRKPHVLGRQALLQLLARVERGRCEGRNRARRSGSSAAGDVCRAQRGGGMLVSSRGFASSRRLSCRQELGQGCRRKRGERKRRGRMGRESGRHEAELHGAAQGCDTE